MEHNNKPRAKGNPAWYAGMPSANPKGRPKGQTSIEAYRKRIRIYFLRWERFCWALGSPPYNGAAAARKAGYSPKSARFIACRLLKKIVVRAILQRHGALVYLYEKTGDMEYSTSGDVIQKMEARMNNENHIKQDENTKRNIDKSLHNTQHKKEGK